MQRWNPTLHTMVDNPLVNHFLRDLHDVYQKHGLCLGHESRTGTFVIRAYNFNDIDYLMKTALDDVSQYSQYNR